MGKSQSFNKPAEEAAPKPAAPEKPAAVRVKALWRSPMRDKLLVQSSQGLYLMDAAKWTSERDFDANPADLTPAPTWDKVTSQIQAKDIARIMVANGLIDEVSLRDPRLQAGAVQELASTFAVALQQE